MWNVCIVCTWQTEREHMKYACPECLREITPPAGGRALHVEDGTPCCVELTQPEAFNAANRLSGELRAIHPKGGDVLPLYVRVRDDATVLIRFKGDALSWELPLEHAAALSDAIRSKVWHNAINKPDPGPDPRRVAQVLTVEAAKLTKVAERLSGESAIVVGELAARVCHASDVLYAFLEGKELPQWGA